MAKTIDDKITEIDTKVDGLGTKLDTLIASGVKVDLSPVLSAETGIQNTANQILNQLTELTPVVASIAPTSGSVNGGDTVTVSGSNFLGSTGVLFGTVAGTNLTVNDDNTLTVVSPAQPAGVVDIRVVDAAGTSAIVDSDKFTYA